MDGQQRSLALAQASHKEIAVPVVAFVSDNLEVQREQFILVDKAKPLPTRLINELLPETRSVLLPRDLSARRTSLRNYAGTWTRTPIPLLQPHQEAFRRRSRAQGGHNRYGCH